MHEGRKDQSASASSLFFFDGLFFLIFRCSSALICRAAFRFGQCSGHESLPNPRKGASERNGGGSRNPSAAPIDSTKAMDVTTIAAASPDGVPFPRSHAKHAPGEVVPPGRDIGLADMPPELLVCIAEQLDRPRDLVAAQIASPLFAHVSLDHFVGCQYANRLCALIEAGAPVGAVRVAIARGRRALPANLILPAVRHGDVSVLDALCRALSDVRIFFFFPFFCLCCLADLFLCTFFFLFFYRIFASIVLPVVPLAFFSYFFLFGLASARRKSPSSRLVFSVVISRPRLVARLAFSRLLCIFFNNLVF
nr:hypothetical protein [Pandoravirus belohorizontensis]